MTLLTSGQKTSQRSDGHKSLVYLSVNKPTTLLTAVVDGVTTRGATAIAFREGSGTTSRIREGQTLRVTIDGRVFTTRVVSFSGTASAGTITVDPNGIAWEDGAGLELVENYELRVIPPTFDPNTGISTKRGQTWSGQTLPAGITPLCLVGTHRPAFLPVPAETMVEASTAAGGDDGFVSPFGGGTIYTNLAFASIGNAGGITTYSAWFRFGLPVPPRSTIISAYLKFIAHSNEPGGENVSALIRAEAADSPTAPVDYTDYNSRARTTAEVEWSISGGWVDGTTEQSPDITEIIQEIIDRPGFAENNAIQFFVEDNGSTAGNYVRARCYDVYNQPAVLHVTYLPPVSVDFDIDLTNSKAMSPGASISSYALSVAPATGAAVSFNTATGVGTVTVSQAGQYWLEGSCTDNNGNTHTGHRRVWAHDPDPDSADYPYVDFVVSNMTIGRDGSGSVDVTVHGVADFTEFVDGALVVFWQQAWYGGTEGPISLIAGGENILFAGYILADTVDYNWQHGTVKFRAVTPVELMKQFRLQGLSIHAENAPAYWFQYDHRLTVARMLHWHGYWHSTLFEIADVDLPSSTEYKKLFKFNEGTLYSQWQDLASKLFATVGCNKAGQIYVERDIQMLDAAGRAAVDVITEITPADLRETVGIIRRHKNQTNVVRLSGWQFDGQTLTPHCSIAPNKQGADSGPGGQNLDGIVVASQAEANMLTGRVLARENNDVSEVRLKFSGNYSALDVAPQRWLTMTLAAGDTPRGIEWTDQRLAIQQIVLGIDQVNGVITTDVVCEPEAFGPDGVDDPCPLVPEAGTEETAPWSGEGEGTLVAFSSVHMRPDSASDWIEKHPGNAGHGCIDPHWQARQGSVNPDDAIVWWVDGAKVYRSVDGGVTAQDVTPATDPPDTWGDTPAPGIENVTFVGIFADRWNQGRFLALARWQNGSSLWRGWLAVTGNDGLIWSWYPVHGASLPTQCRPLWLDLNDSHVYVTAWEDGALWLFDRDPADFSLAASWDLGTVAGSEVEDRTYIAYPRCVLDDSDLVYVFGRMPTMAAPISLSGPQHIISYNGTTWASVDALHDTKYVASLKVGLLDGSDRLFDLVVAGQAAAAGLVLLGDLDVSTGTSISWLTGAAIRKDSSSFVIAWSGASIASADPQIALVDKSALTKSKTTNIYNGSFPGTSYFVYGIDKFSTDKYVIGLAGGLRILAEEGVSSFTVSGSSDSRFGDSGLPRVMSDTRVLFMDEDTFALVGVSGVTFTTLDTDTGHSFPAYVNDAPEFGLVKVTSTVAVAAYVDDGDAGQLKARAIDISGDTITLGTPIVLDATAGSDSVQLALDAGGNVIIGHRQGANYVLDLVDVTGTTLTVLDTDATLPGGDSWEAFMVLEGTTGIVSLNTNGGAEITVYQFSTAGEVITPGTEVGSIAFDGPNQFAFSMGASFIIIRDSNSASSPDPESVPAVYEVTL